MIKKNSALKTVLKLGESCDSCGHCCRFGSGTLADEDVQKIAKFLKLKEDKLKENYLEEIERFNTKRLRPKRIKHNNMPYGQCIFLKENMCSIHAVKPLECKIGNCDKEHGEQLSIWFMLNYFVNKKDPESIRQFAVYLKTGGRTLEGGELKDYIQDKKQLNEILSYKKLR